MQVPFAKDSYLSEVPINWYPAADTDKQVILMGAPGLDSLLALPPGGEVRGAKVAGDSLYMVCDDTVYELNASLNPTAIGTLTTNTGHVWIEYNGVQVAFVDGAHMWVYVLGGVRDVCSSHRCRFSRGQCLDLSGWVWGFY